MSERYGLQGGVISAVDLVRGIGKSAGLEVIEVPGITGYLDTNYEGKAEYALETLQHADFVYVHVEAPDEAGHNGDPQAKVQAIEDFDGRVVGPILAGLESAGGLSGAYDPRPPHAHCAAHPQPRASAFCVVGDGD